MKRKFSFKARPRFKPKIKRKPILKIKHQPKAKWKFPVRRKAKPVSKQTARARPIVKKAKEVKPPRTEQKKEVEAKVKPVLEGWYPKDVEKTKELYDRFKLRAVGPWSQSYLDNTEYAKTLAERHWEHVKKTLAKYMSKPPKNKREAEKMIKEALLSPEQRFLIMYEASLTRPLSPREFQEYLELFKQVAPKAYEGLYGSKTPAQVTAEIAKQERIALKGLKATPSYSK